MPTLGRDELATLITGALDLLSRYRALLGYPVLIWGNHEQEDFDNLLLLLRKGCNAE